MKPGVIALGLALGVAGIFGSKAEAGRFPRLPWIRGARKAPILRPKVAPKPTRPLSIKTRADIEANALKKLKGTVGRRPSGSGRTTSASKAIAPKKGKGPPLSAKGPFNLAAKPNAKPVRSRFNGKALPPPPKLTKQFNLASGKR